MKNLVFLLLLIPSIILSQTKIVELEYWINNNFTSKKNIALNQQTEVIYQGSLDLDLLPIGFHRIHYRFKDNNGKWSTIHQTVFFFSGSSNDDQALITEIEYWIDDDYSTKKELATNGQTEAILLGELELPDAINGLHKITFRAKDNTGCWSTPIDFYFFKAGSSNDEEVKIVKYRYWFDSNKDNPIEIQLEKPSNEVIITNLLDIAKPNQGDFPQTFNIQFLDNTGIWSSVYSKKFLPVPSFEVYNLMNTFTFVNTSAFGRSFIWDFGDGTKDTTVNPQHTYKKPGVYTVKLTAKNSLGQADTFEIVQVKGLRDIEAKSAGNTGDASVFIYGGGFNKNASVWLEGPEKIDADTSYLARLDAIYARFNFRGKQVGLYDVYVQFPGEQPMKLEKAFTVEQGTEPKPFVKITGRDRILFGRWQTYQLTVGNTGNIDATGVPLFLVTSKSNGMELDLSNIKIQVTQAAEIQFKDAYDTLLYYGLESRYPIDEMDGLPFDGYLYVFHIPVIPANSSQSINIRIKTNNDVKIYAWLYDPYFQSPFGSSYAACIAEAIAWYILNKAYDIGTGFIPGYDCVKAIAKLVISTSYNTASGEIDPLGRQYKTWGEWFWGWGSWTVDMTIITAQCAVDFVPAGKVAKTVKKLGEAAWEVIKGLSGINSDMNKLYMADKDCREKYQKKKPEETKIRAVSSFDPNEIVGPQGYQKENYVRNEGEFTYKIYFENLATATAPAQEVIIIDTLDKSKFDLSTFNFGTFGYSGKVFHPFNGLKEFTLEIDSIDVPNTILRINAKVDTSTGTVAWKFTTLDVKTNDYPEDPDAGFLKPNKKPPEGEGFVSFSVKPLDTIPEDIDIANRAKIVFDLNAPIYTNTHSNRFDNTPPRSKLTSIQTTWEKDLYRFLIDVSDELSGVRYFTLYASRDDSDYVPVLTTNQNPFYFRCEPNSVYKFYSIATDSAGNFEPQKTQWEVSTLFVSVDEEYNHYAKFDDLEIFPNPADDFVTISYIAKKDGYIGIKIYNSFGQIIKTEKLIASIGKNLNLIETSSLPMGIYYVTIFTKDNTICKQLIINR